MFAKFPRGGGGGGGGAGPFLARSLQYHVRFSQKAKSTKKKDFIFFYLFLFFVLAFFRDH